MYLIVGNSIVKYWHEHVGKSTRVFCMPGATLDKLLTIAQDESQVRDKYVFIQSGIPDMHIKGQYDIVPERLDLYKRRLLQVHRVIPNAVILLIYPPLNVSQAVCEQYNDINMIIRQQNRVKAPNTISRIFHHGGPSGRWRIDSSRLSDGIHPTKAETSRMVERLYEVDASSNANAGAKDPLPEGTAVDRTVVTIEESSSASWKIERLLIKKKEKLQELEREHEQRKCKIEDECVAAIQKVLDYRDPKRPRTVSNIAGEDCRKTRGQKRSRAKSPPPM
jgi:hypothetical protein